MKQITKNVFSKGLSQDQDPSNVSPYSMTDNINGRIMFNKKGTLDWVENKGNSFSFTLDADSGNETVGYLPIGYAGDGNIKIIFSVRSEPDTSAPGNPVYSEIGILGLDKDGNGFYETLFNDQNDANGDLLNFNLENQITARFLYENDELLRVYFVDGVKPTSNPPRVFTFRFDNTIGAQRNDVSAYEAVSDTVHKIDSQSEFQAGIIKYVQSLSGGILTGVYQYTYRLLTNEGYATPWTTPTEKIFVTSDQVTSTNWNEYEMEGSGQDSGKGNRIEVKGIDLRYDRIQVAYIYSQTNTEILESAIFVDTPVNPLVSSVEFDHLSNNGEPIVIDEIAQRFQGIKKAKTLDIKDNTLYYGNIVENLFSITDDEIEDVLSGLDIIPKFRDMRSDITSINPGAPPLTNQSIITGTIDKTMHNGVTETYDVVNDYTNYKGTQVEHLFKGYFRGEIYRFAIVFYDKIGYPYFALHLADFTFPNQHETNYSWERLKQDGTIISGSGSLAQPAVPTNDYFDASLNSGSIINSDADYNALNSYIRVMGIDVSGIDISGIKDRISGFAIVRTDRDETILNQGLILPTVVDAADGNITRPLPCAHQRFDTSGNYFGVQEYNGGIPSRRFTLRPNLSIYYSPDVFFNQNNKPTTQTNDRLKLIGSCYKASTTNLSELDLSGGYNGAHLTHIGGDDRSPCVISKWYRSKNTYHNAGDVLRPPYGSEANIVYDFIVNFASEVNDYEGFLDFHNSTTYRVDSYPNTEGFGADVAEREDYRGWGAKATVYKHGNFSSTSGAVFAYTAGSGSYGFDTQAGSLICNYVRTNSNPYGGLNLTSLTNTIFYTTGHFQPIGNSDFTESGTDIYDNIEVYGGDCYLDYFGFLRTYGRFEGTLGEDVSYGIVFPFESKINHTLRNAPSTHNPMYTDVGARPWQEFDNPGSTNFPNGLFTQNAGATELKEEFNYNDVLTFTENLKFFNAKPIDVLSVDEFPVRWRNSPKKFLGDPIDTFRQFEVNDFDDLTGSHGAIVTSTKFNNQIYSWQETAYGRLRAYDRAALETENVGSLTTGVGPSLDGIDYIDETVGCQNQFALVNTGRSIYWPDVFNGKLMRFAANGQGFLSDIKGLHNFFDNELSNFLHKDNPANKNGIWGSFDANNRDVLFTFQRNEFISQDTDYAIQSEVPELDGYLPNNETLFINRTVPPVSLQGIIVPFGAELSGTNTNVINYISVSGSPVYIVQDKDNIKTDIGLATAGNYRLYRDSVNDDWQLESVNYSDITPFRSTIVYNEYQQSFTEFRSFKPTFYISHNDFLLSQDYDMSKLDFYIHGKNPNRAYYYGRRSKSMITISVNDRSEFSKAFDNIRVSMNKTGSETVRNFIYETETQKRYYDMSSDPRKKYQEDGLRFPLKNFTQKERMRGRWLGITLEFNNNTQLPAKIDNFISYYRISNRT